MAMMLQGADRASAWPIPDSVHDHVHGAGMVAQGGQASVSLWIFLTIISAMGILLPIVMTVLKNRRELREERLRLIRELAAAGKLGSAELDRLLHPPSKLGTLVMVVAWFALIGGIGTLVYWGVWECRSDDFLVTGICLVGFSLATLSTPIMLRELRRQEALGRGP